MIIAAGLALISVGVVAEMAGGTYFRRFFDRRFPPSTVRHDDVRIKVRLARTGLMLGLVLFVAGLIAAVA